MSFFKKVLIILRWITKQAKCGTPLNDNKLNLQFLGIIIIIIVTFKVTSDLMI